MGAAQTILRRFADRLPVFRYVERIPEFKAVPRQFTPKVKQFGRLLHVSITTAQRMK